MTYNTSKRYDDTLLLLSVGTDFTRLDRLLIEVHPSVASRCNPDRRFVLADDLRHTYLVERTESCSGTTWARVFLRRGRPILNTEYLTRLFKTATLWPAPTTEAIMPSWPEPR
jgi:hypothetical protein